jgi:N-hydroxyarylamine O-acetyltransferase
MDVDAYLQRLSYSGARVPDAATLAALHLAHMRAVPFENLDIGRGVPIVLDLDALYAKLVERGRGGFCYELNGVFAELLRALGYQVELLSARVFDNGLPGAEFDHLALRVTGGALSEPYLADVGFGQSFLRPLRLVALAEQADASGAYQLTETGGEWVLETRDDAGAWIPSYTFTLTPRAFSDFAAMCHFQQTSPESSFTRRRLCSLATPGGRITLTGDKLIVTRHGQRTEQPVADEAAFASALREHFGLVLETSAA